jgi:hypothetical protein
VICKLLGFLKNARSITSLCQMNTLV